MILFVYPKQPSLRKWLHLFPSVSCEPWAKYTHASHRPSSPRPGAAHPGCLCTHCKSNSQDPHPVEAHLPCPEKALLGRGVRLSGRAGPSGNRGPSTLDSECFVLCGDRACLLQHSPRAQSFLQLPVRSFRKVPIMGAWPVPLWLWPQCPWSFVGHSAPWD